MKVFTIEAFNGGSCLRNIDYDGLLLQTEMNAAHNLRTHDQPYAISWARLLMNYQDAAWTVENGTYTGNWLGLWTPAHGYHDGEEMACNKTGDDIAHFQLFAISKDRFHADYVNALGGSSTQTPLTLTPLIASPDFAGYGWPGWTVTGTWGNQRFNGAAEVWHSTGFEMYQTLTGLPEGKYTVTCQMSNGDGAYTGYLYATSDADTQKAVVSQSSVGSNFDAERDKMAANDNYGLLTVEVNVNDGTLTFGIKEPTSGTTWLVWDNFTLTYHGGPVDAIEDIPSTCSPMDTPIYDLQGRRLTKTPTKGFYIKNGKKYFVR